VFPMDDLPPYYTPCHPLLGDGISRCPSPCLCLFLSSEGCCDHSHLEGLLSSPMCRCQCYPVLVFHSLQPPCPWLYHLTNSLCKLQRDLVFWYMFKPAPISATEAKDMVVA
jgi:hypothetical protein